MENFSREERVKLYIELFQTIEKIHDKNLVHFDIKPDNIMANKKFVSSSSDNHKDFHMVLIDFGLMSQKFKPYEIGNM